MKKLFFSLALILFCKIGFSQNVIDPVLQDVLNQKGDEMIDINIIFKSQIDLNKLRTRTLLSNDKKTRRNILVDELKHFSEEKQQEVLSLLQAEKSSDRVSNIRTYWLSNAISCTVNRDVVYLLAKHPDIEFIGYDKKQYMLFDEEQQTTYNSQPTRDEEIDITDNVTMVKADKVWELGYTGKGVIVAVIDSGVNYNHADLKDHLWDGGAQYPNHGYNVIDNNNDPMDKTGHGTHCAGTICGDGTSGVHSGVAPDATLMCVKALDDYGYGTASSFNAGMEFAVENHADILSMSLGIMNASVSDRVWLRNTCINALELGVIASVAAGNDGNMMMAPVPNNIRTPGNCPPPWLSPDQQSNPGGLSCVVSVGAIDFSRNMYENGSKGPVTWTGTEFNDYPYDNNNIGLIRPDVCAPGVGIKSLDYDSNDGYNLKSGTSMATPCVAGVMALLLEKQNDLSPADICMLLETTADKLTETKSNLYGAGLVDAFKAITSIKTGALTYNGFSINDSEYNNDGNLNAGEKVRMSVNIANTSDEAFDNLKVTVSCSNDMVNISDAEAEIKNIAANEEIILADEFEFSVDENLDYKTPLSFEFNISNEDGASVSSFCILMYASDSELEFSSFIVRNDDNSNGILEAGETADLGVIINNIGNVLAVRVDGTLSSSSDIVTINQAEATFSSVGTNSSAIAFFNVTVAGNAGENLNIPFELKTIDLYENEKIFSSKYVNNCNYIFQLEDYYNDGWEGSAVLVKYSNEKPTDTLTIVSGGFKEYRIGIGSNVEVTLEWLSKGKYDGECSFVVMTEFYELIYRSPEFPNRNTFLFSWINDCSCENESYKMCDAVKNLEGKQNENGIELTWTTDGTAVGYEIYRGTKLIGTTEETSFIDANFSGKGDFVYSVRAVYDDCVGLFQDVAVHFDTEMIDEKHSLKATIYPNPSRGDFNVRCENMTKVTVYNVVGNKIMENEISGDSYIIRGLESGVYFVDIQTDKGNTVVRILEF